MGQGVPGASRGRPRVEDRENSSERPYKKAWTVDAATKLIRDNSGKHFDPGLVEVFHRELPGIVAIREHYS